MRNASQTAGGLNAAISRSRYAEYLPTRLSAANTDTLLAWAAGVDAATYFDDLGTDAALMWDEHGFRLGYLMDAFARDRVRKGDTQPVAMLAAWNALSKPPFICARFADGRIKPTSVAFPTATPLSRWLVPVANDAAFNTLVAGGASAVTAALVAAQ